MTIDRPIPTWQERMKSASKPEASHTIIDLVLAGGSYAMQECIDLREAREALLQKVAQQAGVVAILRGYVGGTLDGLFDYHDLDAFDRIELAEKHGLVTSYEVTEAMYLVGDCPGECVAGDTAYRLSDEGRACVEAYRVRTRHA